MYSATKNDIKNFAQKIESLAKEVVNRVDNNGDILTAANDLVRSSSTFVFVLGEVHAVEQLTKDNVKSDKKVCSSKIHNYHNLRDSFGRFKKA